MTTSITRVEHIHASAYGSELWACRSFVGEVRFRRSSSSLLLSLVRQREARHSHVNHRRQWSKKDKRLNAQSEGRCGVGHIVNLKKTDDRHGRHSRLCISLPASHGVESNSRAVLLGHDRTYVYVPSPYPASSQSSLSVRMVHNM